LRLGAIAKLVVGREDDRLSAVTGLKRRCSVSRKLIVRVRGPGGRAAAYGRVWNGILWALGSGVERGTGVRVQGLTGSGTVKWADQRRSAAGRVEYRLGVCTEAGAGGWRSSILFGVCRL
jgi:hypothetical protein